MDAVLARTPPLAAARIAREWASTRERFAWPEPPAGDGRPALLVPGFLAGDGSLRRMGAWLHEGGFVTGRSGIAFNVSCMEPVVDELERRLDAAVERTGKRGVVVGQSRGGVIGRALAVRRPDLVETLVTLGSPLLHQLSVHPWQWANIGLVGLMGTMRVPGFFSVSCIRGDCCARSRGESLGAFPAGTRFVSLYSQADEVVRWRSCLDPAAELVEIPSTHLGMGMDRVVWEHLQEHLAPV